MQCLAHCKQSARKATFLKQLQAIFLKQGHLFSAAISDPITPAAVASLHSCQLHKGGHHHHHNHPLQDQDCIENISDQIVWLSVSKLSPHRIIWPSCDPVPVTSTYPCPSTTHLNSLILPSSSPHQNQNPCFRDIAIIITIFLELPIQDVPAHLSNWFNLEDCYWT